MYGLKIFNVRSRCMVNSDLFSFIFVESGTFTRTRDIGTVGDDRDAVNFTSLIPFSKGAPLVAIRPLTTRSSFWKWRACVCGYHLDGDNYKGFNLDWYYSGDPEGETDTVDWAIFRMISASEIPSDDYGVFTFNSSGDLTWSSSMRALQFVDKYRFDYSVMNGLYFDVRDVSANYFLSSPAVFEDDIAGAARLGFSCHAGTNRLMPAYMGNGVVPQGTGNVYPYFWEVAF